MYNHVLLAPPIVLGAWSMAGKTSPLYTTDYTPQHVLLFREGLNIRELTIRTHHFILSESTSLVSEEVLDSAQFFRDGTAADHCPWDGSISLDHPGIHHLPHVQIHTKTEAIQTHTHNIQYMYSGD